MGSAKLSLVSAHYFSNPEIAELLRNIAAALQLVSEEDNRFRIIAYNRAADAIEHASSDIKDLWDNHELNSVPGIGESIASNLDELFSKGHVFHFQEILKNNPKAFYELLKIPGIGPVTAHKLCHDLGLSKKAGCIAKLKKAAAKGRVSDHLLAPILNYSDAPKRLFLHQATLVAQDLITYLKSCPQVIDCQPLGSLRRQVSTVGDIDLAVSTRIPTSVISHFCAYSKKSQVIEAGNTMASLLLREGTRVDLMTCDPGQFGSLLQHLTGSKHHNIALREHALKLGYSLSEYGVKKINTRNTHQFTSEKDLYNFLKLDFIPPELREDTGEITAAISHHLPELVQLSDIKGDLHIHTSYDTETSHDLGQSPIAVIIDKAKSLNYSYIGLTEHNPSVANHISGKIYSILQNKKALVEKYNSNDLFLFNGLEIDILFDGQIALSEDCFDLLEYAVVSIHSSFRQTKKKMTERIIRGLSHPKALIFGHPTGRLLQEREGINIDWDSLFDYCQKNHKILEIDSWPNRLDLPDSLVREAVKNGVKIIINTDSHCVDHLDYLKFGVSVARRGWAAKSDIINTYSLSQLKEVIHE